MIHQDVNCPILDHIYNSPSARRKKAGESVRATHVNKA